MDKRRADIERSLRRDEYPKFDHDPRELFRRRRRPDGNPGLEPTSATPRGGGGSSGGAAVAIDPTNGW